MAKLNDKFEFEQDGKTYSLYELPDGFVIEGDVNLFRKGLTELPDLSKVTVRGDFYCSYNKLTSLQGAPREVGGDFYCRDSELTSLTGAPQKVGGDFYCSYNELTSLTGAPREVGGDFYCSNNDNLFSLFGLPQMQEDKGIYCDDDLMERYNCLKKEDEYNYYYIEYKDLIESAKYQSELSVYKIRQKKHEEKKESQAKLKAEFEAFMKMQTEERE